MVNDRLTKLQDLEVAKNKKCQFHVTVLNEMILEIIFLFNILVIFHQSPFGQGQVGLCMTWVISCD